MYACIYVIIIRQSYLRCAVLCCAVALVYNPYPLIPYTTSQPPIQTKYHRARYLAIPNPKDIHPPIHPSKKKKRNKS
ncbi:hypothetical protein BO71DRAFT_94967 [Aspergillus ellipticus CBS 707.79]|uniref:Uncharacterized protein n=1 Tax=Aspergillus ellipticus CBS 707.79 TaxID=1448320 RepID=A0A319DPD2_9EURO|nr:hypothetical protein BO71DRAFT_94967 [Aspergillus ellipticus CBS 707.79]